MANQYGESYHIGRNFSHGRFFPEVRECMNDILNNVVKRSCYQTALHADSFGNKIYNGVELVNIGNQMENGKKKRKPKEKKSPKRKVTKKKSQTILSQQKMIAKQERICKRKQQELEKANTAVSVSKKMVDDVKDRIKNLEMEHLDAQKQIAINENILSCIPRETQIETVTPSLTITAGLVPPSEPNPMPIIPLKDMKGSEHMIASKLPPNFPPELAFRALSTYALLRSLSLPLRLSPFNPTSFIRALSLPVRTRLLGEVHLSLLGYLFSSIKTGSYETRGNFHRDLGSKAARGGLNLSYMDSNTWTNFFEDYAELTIEKFIADDDVMINTKYLTRESKEDEKDEFVDPKISTDKDLALIDRNLEESAEEVAQVFQGDSDDTDGNDDSDSDGDIEEYMDSSNQLSKRKIKRKGGKKNKGSTAMNSRPSRGAKIEAAKRIQESKSDDDSISLSNDETSLPDPPSNKTETIVPPLNQDSSFNPQSSLAETITSTPIEKETDLPPPSTEPIKRKRGRPRKIIKQKKPKKETSDVEKRKRGRPRKKKKKIDEKPIAIDRRSKADRQSINAIKLEERRGAGRPPAIINPPEPVSSHISTALIYYLATPPDKPLRPHFSPVVQAKISLLKNLPHVNAARRLRHGQSYHDLPILTKLEVLEFLIDDFLQTYPISCELLHRHRITSYYQGKYGLLPSKTELGNLTNVDECVVCGLEGDLICCDGCIASYHCKCTGLASEESLPEGIWLCQECHTPNPSKFGPLYGGSKGQLDWFSMKDFIPVVQSENLTASLQNLKCEKPTIGLPQASTVSVSTAISGKKLSEVPGSNSKIESIKPIEGHEKKENDTKNEPWKNTTFLPPPTLNTLPSPTLNSLPTPTLNTLPSPTLNTLPTPTLNTLPTPTLNTLPTPTLNTLPTPTLNTLPTPTLNTLPTPTLNANVLKLSHIKLRPTISFSDEREFMIIHGFVFIRRKEAPSPYEPQTPPIPISQKELVDLLRSLGPHYSLKWPWCQIPFNPFDIWEDVIDSLDANTMLLFEEKRKHYGQYFMSSESHNPTAYENVYRKAQLPPYLSIIAKSSGPNFRREEILRYQVINGLSRDLDQDKSYLQRLFSRRLYYDVLYGCKEYIIKLEKTLFKACFLSELWGINKQVIPNLWMNRVMKCKSVNKLAKLCIELVDSTHSRAFYDDWNRPVVQIKSRHASEGTERTQVILTDDWTPEQECIRRDWERSNIRDSLTLLTKEGNRLGGSTSGRKRRGTMRLDTYDPALPTLMTSKKYQGISLKKETAVDTENYLASMEREMMKKQEIEQRLALEESAVEEKDHDANMHNDSSGVGSAKANLAMTPGAIRARERRRREKEEREKLKRETLRRVKVEAEYAKQQMMEASTNNDANIVTLDHSEEAVKGLAQNENEKKKKKRKKIPLSSRRRSGRHISRPLTVEEAIDSLNNGNSAQMLDLALAMEINPTIDLEIKKTRREKIAVLEKILEKSADRETHWPICGGFFFPPAGNLPLPILKRLARNAGMKLAPFMTYSNKFEVAQPSQSHCWRKKTIECDTIEELSLQLTILDSFLNRPTIHSCDVLSRRSENAKASVPKVIKCTHYDSLTGLMEHFVLNKKKNKGTWLSEVTVDQSALILERSNRIAEWQQKFDSKLFEKRRRERAEREEKDRKIHMMKNAELTLKNAQSRASMIQSAIFYAKNDVVQKLEGVKKSEQTQSNLQMELDRENEQLEKQKINLIHEMERRKKEEEEEEEEKLQQSINSNFKNDASEAQLERAFLDYIDHDIQILNAQEDSTTNFHSEEIKYENAFLNAVNSHKQATKRLLKESADLGLSTVPVEKMNEERIIHMARMKDSNRKLYQMKSSKYIDDDGLTKALAAAEDAGLQLYVKQAEDEKQEYNNSDKSLFNDNDDNACYQGFNSRDSENRAKDESEYLGHQSLFDQNPMGSIEQQANSNRRAKQQQVQQMTEQNLVTGVQQFPQAGRGDYSGMNKAMSQSDYLLMQPGRSSMNQLNNIGQRMSTELNNQYLLELERQPQIYQRDGTRKILEDSNAMSKSDIFSAQINNQVLMRPNLYGDNLTQFPAGNSNFSALPSNFQGGNNYSSLRNQQFSGQYSDSYTNSNILDYDNVNNTALRPMDNSFTQQVQQQRNQQSYLHGASQQRAQMSLGLSQIDQHGRLISSNHHSLQSNNNHNPSNFNLW